MELFAFDIFIMPWKYICVHAYTYGHRHAHVLIENPSQNALIQIQTGLKNTD